MDIVVTPTAATPADQLDASFDIVARQDAAETEIKSYSCTSRGRAFRSPSRCSN